MRVADLGRRGILNRLEGPELAARGEVDGFGLGRGIVGRRGGTRVGRAHRDPGREVGDLRGAELVLGRHLEFLVRITHGADEEAVVGLARHERGTGFAALEQRRAGVEAETRTEFLGRGGAVAFVAMLDQQRADFLFKKLEGFGCGGCRQLRRGGAPDVEGQK